MCIVVNDEHVVLGRLRGAAFDGDPSTPIEQVMESGPTTIRPDVLLRDIIERLHGARVDSILVASEAGRLVGILYKDDVEWALGEIEVL